MVGGGGFLEGFLVGDKVSWRLGGGGAGSVWGYLQ